MFSTLTVAPVRGHGQADTVADQAGSRSTRTTRQGATSSSAAGHLTVTPTSPDRRPGSSAGPRSTDVHASPTTAPRRSNVEFCEQDGGFVMQARRRVEDQHRPSSPTPKAHRSRRSRRRPRSTATGQPGKTGNVDSQASPQRRSVGRHRRLPGNGDGQPGRLRRRRRLLHRRRQRLARRPPRSTPTTRPLSRGPTKASLPEARNAVAAGVVGGQIVVTGWLGGSRSEHEHVALRPGG